MTNTELARALGVSERHCRRLKARRDARIQRVLDGLPALPPPTDPLAELTLPSDEPEIEIVIPPGELDAALADIKKRFPGRRPRSR